MAPDGRPAPPARCPAASAGTRDRQLRHPQQADAEHLAREPPAAGDGREQQLDDARGLLLGHADGHGVAERDQRGEERQEPDGQEALVGLDASPARGRIGSGRGASVSSAWARVSPKARKR